MGVWLSFIHTWLEGWKSIGWVPTFDLDIACDEFNQYTTVHWINPVGGENKDTSLRGASTS